MNYWVHPTSSSFRIKCAIGCSINFGTDEGYIIRWGKQSLSFAPDAFSNNSIQINTLTANSDWRLPEDILEITGFNITPQHGSAGIDMPISISPTYDNEGLDRTVEVIATCGDQTDILTLIHIGKREIFIPSDGVFILKDDSTFDVLKQIY